MPSEVDANTPVAAAELKESFFAWNNVKEVTFTGYCAFFFDEGAIDSIVKIKASPDAKEDLIECHMIKQYPENFSKKTPVTIKGTFERNFFGKIIMKDCEVIEKGKEAKDAGYVDPFNYAGEIISAKDYHDSFYAWVKKEVTVSGYYHSTTTSTTSYGTTVRVDLTDKEMGDKMVGCEMKGKVPDDIANKREGVLIKGIIGEESFGNVQLEECEFVNR